MIRIHIEIVPGGDEKRRFTQAVAEIHREPGGGIVADYAVSAGESQNPHAEPGGRLDWAARGHILGHDRRQSVWALAAKVAAWAAAEALKAE